MIYYVETNSVSMLDFALSKIGREDGRNTLVYVGRVSSAQVNRMAGIRFMLIRCYNSRERAVKDNGPIEECEAVFITKGDGESPDIVKCQRTIKGPMYEVTICLEYDETKLWRGMIHIDNEPSWKDRCFENSEGFCKWLNFLTKVKSVSLCCSADVTKFLLFIDGDSCCFNEDWDVDKFIISKLLME